ncbi:MAG: DUF4982 domain-containing protein [Calditrichaceae bacterium]|nr:DUF4982 domain-containing protein [Calditrichaceae bacterium]
MKLSLISFRILVISVCLITSTSIIISSCSQSEITARTIEDFNNDWKFNLGDIPDGQKLIINDSNWRLLNLPHDWSIEGTFREDNPATAGGGALPGGIGWYRKSFQMPLSQKDKLVFIEFDGVYQNSEVWINEQYLGKRPYGYISFSYELSSYLKYGDEPNIIAMKVDNSKQPNSRWYSGSGIYRNVRLVTTDPIHIKRWGTFVTTQQIEAHSVKILVQTKVQNSSDQNQQIELITSIINPAGKQVSQKKTYHTISADSMFIIEQNLEVENPALWSIENPSLYKAVIHINAGNKLVDNYETIFGIRSFSFDVGKGFFLNGKNIKIKGVCNHHDLGCLGAAINARAIERQLEILKEMGCNAIRTSHNPPAPELLDLCDKMGFIVMDEAFDIWAIQKTEFDYHLYFDQWHQRDLRDFILRDRNHPSIFIWSIGNEVIEQYDHDDPSGREITDELCKIVRSLDTTRPITAGCNDTNPLNPLFTSGSLDLIGFNYHHQEWNDFPKNFPGKKFIATETESALATRGSYDMPSDSIRRWPMRWDLPFYEGNADFSCSSYDNCSAPWGSTHEETWKAAKKLDFVSGVFIWTGFDYLGEPTPYGWPAKSSYFGIIDLAGFPKDAYYFYQCEWTEKSVLHLLPHWNWKEGQNVDVWAYTNCDEVELILNNQSQGIRKKSMDDLHLMWRIPFTAGTLKAIGRTPGKQDLVAEVKTAGAAANIQLEADRTNINADGKDLSFITVTVLDENGTLVPHADNLINFTIKGPGKIAGVDNGNQTSHESFQANSRSAFNGMCLAVIQTSLSPGIIHLSATSEGLQESTIEIQAK